MSEGVDPPEAEAPIGDLFRKLVDDGRAYAQAEINLYKQLALRKAAAAKTGAAAIAVGATLALAGLVAFMVALVMGLAPLIGPVGGGVAVLAGAGLVGGLLIRFGAARLSGGSDS